MSYFIVSLLFLSFLNKSDNACRIFIESCSSGSMDIIEAEIGHHVKIIHCNEANDNFDWYLTRGNERREKQEECSRKSSCVLKYKHGSNILEIAVNGEIQNISCTVNVFAEERSTEVEIERQKRQAAGHSCELEPGHGLSSSTEFTLSCFKFDDAAANYRFVHLLLYQETPELDLLVTYGARENVLKFTIFSPFQTAGLMLSLVAYDEGGKHSELARKRITIRLAKQPYEQFDELKGLEAIKNLKSLRFFGASFQALIYESQNSSSHALILERLEEKLNSVKIKTYPEFLIKRHALQRLMVLLKDEQAELRPFCEYINKANELATYGIITNPDDRKDLNCTIESTTLNTTESTTLSTTERLTKNTAERKNQTDKTRATTTSIKTITPIQNPSKQDKIIVEEYPDYEVQQGKTEDKIKRVEDSKKTAKPSFGKVISFIGGHLEVISPEDRITSFSVNNLPIFPYENLSTSIVNIVQFGRKTIPFALVYYLKKQNYTYKEFLATSTDVVADFDTLSSIHRINVPSGYGCTVELLLFPVIESIQFVFTRNQRPSLKDFYVKKNVYKLPASEGRRLYECPFKLSKTDDFVYIAVLPDGDPLQARAGVMYFAKFSLVACLLFDKVALLWRPSYCQNKIMNDFAMLRCTCKHASIHAASISEASYKLDDLHEINFYIPYRSDWYIIHALGIVFAFYCAALTFIIFIKPRNFSLDKITLTADNMKNDFYAYLIIVKTGNVSFCGTTSNVIIRLFGEHLETEPYVLNYPDPEKRFFRKGGEDWFVICSAIHLGAIQSIEMWVDLQGYRPSWFCRYVIIVDFQTELQYYYKVYKWLSSAKRSKYIAKVDVCLEKDMRSSFGSRLHKNIRFYTSAEHTCNVFSRRLDEYFTYPERITVILALIYTHFFLVLITMNHALPPSSAFGYPIYGRDLSRLESLATVVAVSFAAYIINYPFFFIFRYSQKRKVTNQVYYEVYLLSERVNRYAWIALISWIIFLMVYLIIFGFWIPLSSGILWLLGVIASLILSAIVVETIAIILTKMCVGSLAKFRRRYYDFEAIIGEIERQRKVLFFKFGEMLFRPHFRDLYSKMNLDLFMARKQILDEHSDIINQIKNLIIFAVIFALGYIMVFSRNNNCLIESHVHMTEMLSVEDSLYNIEEINHIYDYLNNTIIELMHPKEWYEGWPINDAGLMSDCQTKLMGVVQLRQQRRKQKCEILNRFAGNNQCRNNESSVFTDKSNYENGSKITSFPGAFETYNSEGFIARLGRNRKNSIYILNSMKLRNWIDINTKVIIIEFWTYNVNCNSFSWVQVVIERGGSGHYDCREKVVTGLLIFERYFDRLFFVCVLGLLQFAALMMVIYIVLTFIRHTKNTTEQIWDLFDLILVALVLGILYTVIKRERLTESLLKDLEEKDHNVFVYFFETASLVEDTKLLLALLVFFATLRLWKIFRFSLLFQLSERSVLLSTVDCSIIFFAQIVVSVGIGVLYHRFFGIIVEDFSTFGDSLLFVILESMKFTRNINTTGIPISLAVYGILQLILLFLGLICLTLYSTVILIYFNRSKLYFSNKRLKYNIVDFMVDEARFRYGIKNADKNLRMRLQAGRSDDVYEHRFVTPKATEKRYANAYLVTDYKTKTMRLIATIVITRRHPELISPSAENKYRMLQTMLHRLERIEITHDPPIAHLPDYELARNIFFIDKSNIVSNTALLRMEYLTERILHDDLDSKPLSEGLSELNYWHSRGDADRLQFFCDMVEMLCDVLKNIVVKVKNPNVSRKVKK